MATSQRLDAFLFLQKDSHMKNYDRRLSLAIDAIHWELDQLANRTGFRVLVRRWWLRRELRKLEGQIP